MANSRNDIGYEKREAEDRSRMPDSKLSGSESIHGSMRFSSYPGRSRALGEIHARPSPNIKSGRVILHYAFMSEGGHAVNQAILNDLARARGESGPSVDASYHEMEYGSGLLRWERHSEFATYMWEGPAPKSFRQDVNENPFGAGFGTPGPLISGVRLEIRKLTAASKKLLNEFDPASLCVTQLSDNKSMLATDFRQNADGQTVFLLLEDAMSDSAIGVTVKTAIEIETYRTLAMLGLPLAQSLSRDVSKIEVALSSVTSDMRKANSEQGRHLLEQISNLAAELEAGAVSSLFRFGASRAYGNIVTERIEILSRRAPVGYRDIATFLENRLAPALRTCRSVEERQANLSRKLTRAANLLRTRIEVEIEQQNRNLLTSMDRRAKLQLRLQQTVEGLSVAAISYYVVGLFYYLAQALEPILPFGVSPKVAAGMFVPFAVVGLWMVVRRIRKHHAEEDAAAEADDNTALDNSNRSDPGAGSASL